MRRGFFFTALFLGMFLALLSFAVFYKSSVQAWDVYVSQKQAGGKIADTADDIKWDLRQLLGISGLSIGRSGATTTVALSARIPSAAADPGAALAAYAAFVAGNYSQRAGANATLDAASLAAPSVYFDQPGFNVSWGNPSQESLVADSASLVAVESRGRLSAACNGTGVPRCAFVSPSWSWVPCGAGTLNVSLRVTDPGGSAVSVNGAESGCVSASAANNLTVVGDGGNLTFSAGTVGSKSPAFGIGVTGSIGYDSVLSANLSYSGPVRARLPVSLSVNGRAFGSLVLAEG